MATIREIELLEKVEKLEKELLAVKLELLQANGTIINMVAVIGFIKDDFEEINKASSALKALILEEEKP